MILEELRREVEDAQGEIAVLWQEMSTGEVRFEHRADARKVSASVIKIPIMLAALEEVQKGRLSLNIPLKVPQEEILEDSEVFDIPREASLEELLTWMIILSDNTSTNVLIEALGMDSINRYCRDLGLDNTSLQRKMLDFGAIGQGRNNYTSPRDMERVFRRLHQEELLIPALCKKALSILGQQRHKSLMLRYIWEDIPAAHKTGGLDYLTHDTGLFYFPGQTYFLGVFIQNAPDIKGDPRRIGRISRLILNNYKEGASL